MSAEKPKPLEINSINALDVVTFLRGHNRDSHAALVMNMFMKITELEIEARVRAEMQPPQKINFHRPRGMGGVGPDSLRATFDETTSYGTPEDMTRIRAQQEEWRTAAALAQKYRRCVPCARAYSAEGEWPEECSTGGCPFGDPNARAATIERFARSVKSE